MGHGDQVLVFEHLEILGLDLQDHLFPLGDQVVAAGAKLLFTGLHLASGLAEVVDFLGDGQVGLIVVVHVAAGAFQGGDARGFAVVAAYSSPSR